MTLTMSHFDKKEFNALQIETSKALPRDSPNKNQSPNKLVYVSEKEDNDQQDVSPLIIQTNSLAIRAIHLRQENKLKL